MKTDTAEHILLILFGQLIGEVPLALRAVGFRVENQDPDEPYAYIHYFMQGEPSEEDMEDLDCVTTNVMCGVPCNGESIFIRKDFPEPLPKGLMYAFSRDTHLPQQFDPSHIADWSATMKKGLQMSQALLGNISPKLRCVGVDEDTSFATKIRFILDKNPTEKDLALTRAAASNLQSDFIKFETQVEVIPFPQNPPPLELVFKRKEPLVLKDSWKEDTLYLVWKILITEVPPQLRAIAVHPENVASPLAKGSITHIYFFFDDDIPKQDEAMLRKKTEYIWGLVTEQIEPHFSCKKVYEPLPNVGEFIFARNTERLFSSERILHETSAISDDAWTISQCLIGKVPSHLRAAGVRTWSPASMDIFFFLDPNATSQEKELLKQAANEMISRFPMRRIHVQLEEYPYPNELPKTINYAYKRREP